MDSPCTRCPFEWFDLRNGSSCKDECQDYKKWLGLAKFDEALKTLESGVPLPSVDELAKSGKVKVVVEPRIEVGSR